MAPPRFWEYYTRLEPERPNLDLAEGLTARVADPTWFLARQWHLGEQHGEDTSTPVVVEVEVRRLAIEQEGGDPVKVPPEGVLEAGPESWWTIARRLRVGRQIAARLSPAERAQHAIGELPAPYDIVDPASVDGLAVWRERLHPGDAAFAGVPVPPADRWSPETLTYDDDFAADGVEGALVLRGHDGGPLDWYSVDGTDPGLGAGAPTTTTRVLASRLSWPGAPHPRWWQIEDHRVDWAGEGPDRSHMATVLLLELLTGHGDDWFTFPVPDPPAERDHEPPPTTGQVVELVTTSVLDDMGGEPWALAPPLPGWSLFRTAGLRVGTLIVWPAAVTPIAGPVLDRVVLAVDEDTDLAWAVELTVDGKPVLPDAENLRARAQVEGLGASGASHGFDYAPSSPLPQHWHPYRLEETDAGRTYVQGLVPDLNDPARLAGQAAPLRPGPVSTLIGGAHGEPFGVGHRLRPTALSNQGLALERRFMLARTTDGTPLLWIERSRHPLNGGPASWLRFDVLTARP